MITKQDYNDYITCGKYLYLKQHKPETLTQPSEYDQLLMREGIHVGEVARDYFGPYKLIDRNKYTPKICADMTEYYMKKGEKVIAEASFLVDDLSCAVDLLVRNENGGYDIYEVKSSAKFEKCYEDDVAFQYHALKKAGVNVGKAYVMHLNGGYVKNGDIDLQQLFVTREVEVTSEKEEEIERNLVNIREIKDKKKDPGLSAVTACRNCVAHNECYKNMPKNNVWDIANFRGAAKFIKDHGVENATFENVLKAAKEKEFNLNEKQVRQIELALTGKHCRHVDIAAVEAILGEASYPIYHLDFETVAAAIPNVDGYKPYQQRITQYSLHIQNSKDTKPEELIHKEYLQESLYDNSEEVADRLIEDLGKSGSISVYSPFENSRLDELKERLEVMGKAAKASAIQDIMGRLWDESKIFQQQAVYDTDQEGSWSIKHVLPAMAKEYDSAYKDLPLAHNGTDAVNYTVKLWNTTGEEHERIKEGLLKYCGLDTLAEYATLVAVYKALEEAKNAVEIKKTK